MSYIAANGQEITEATIGSWCDAYERGDFPKGKHTVGEVVMGNPSCRVNAKIVTPTRDTSKRIGAMKGKWEDFDHESFQALDAEIADLMGA